MEKGKEKTNFEKRIRQSFFFSSSWTPWGIESALTDESIRNKFKNRSNFDFIVLFDANSYENDLQMGHPLLGLKQAIYQYDRDVQLKREPLILEGGYEDWMQFYPGESTAPLPTRRNDNLKSFGKKKNVEIVKKIVFLFLFLFYRNRLSRRSNRNSS